MKLTIRNTQVRDDRGQMVGATFLGNGSVADEVNSWLTNNPDAIADAASQDVSDWLEDNITQPTNPVIDASLSVSGAAADAKAAGDAINAIDIKTPTREVYDYISKLYGANGASVPTEWVADSYVKHTNGEIASYVGWHRSDYILLPNGAKKIYLSCEEPAAANLKYNIFYNGSKRFISNFNQNEWVTIPNNAVYIITSCDTKYDVLVKYEMTDSVEDLFSQYNIDLGAFVEGEYVEYNGTFVTTASGWHRTGYIAIPDGVYRIKLVSSNVSYNANSTDILYGAFYDSSKVFIERMFIDNDNPVPHGAKYFAVSMPITMKVNAYVNYHRPEIVEMNLDKEPLVIQSGANRSSSGFSPTKSCVSLLHFSDLHGSQENFNRIVDYANYYRRELNAIVNSGDMTDLHNGNYTDLLANGHITNRLILSTIGNHDTFTYNESEETYTRSSKATTYANVYSHLNYTWKNSGLTYMSGDNSMTWFRYVGSHNEVMIIGLDDYYDIEAQCTWLAERLAEAKAAGAGVITVSHEMTSAITTPLETNFMTKESDTFAGTYNERFDEVISTWVESGGTHICHLCGHECIDVAMMSKHNVLNIAVEAATAKRLNWQNCLRQEGTKTFDAFNIVSVDPNLGLLKVVRIGDDSDIYMRKKEAFCWDYINKEMVYTDASEGSVAGGRAYSPILDQAQIIGHRANSIAQFNVYRNNGLKFVESDIMITSDNVPILSHDATFTVSGTTYTISQMTHADIVATGKIFDTLSDLLMNCKKYNIALYLDIKNGSASNITDVYNLVRDWGMLSMTVFGTITPQVASVIGAINKSLIFDYAGNTIATVDKAIQELPQCALIIMHYGTGANLPTSTYINAVKYAHRKGLKSYNWTVDDASVSEANFNVGADYVMSNTVTNWKLDDGNGFTPDMKQAILACFQNVAWINEDGQTYYDALETALYPPANLVSISAVYTQSGAVYDTDSLDSLRADLVVTAYYDNGTGETVTAYTLSGTLTEGASTITVTYGGKTTTFNVTVTAAPNWSISNSLTNVSNSNNATQIAHGSPYSATLTPSTGYYIASITITMGGTDVTSLYYADGSINIGAVTGNVVITAVGQLEPETGLVYSNSEPIVTDGATLVDTGFAPADGAFTIMCEWSNPTFSNGAALFSLYQSTSTSNHTVAAVTMGYPAITYATQSYSFGNTLSDLNQTPLRVVVTKAAGNSTPVWYYKNTNGNLATKTTSNNPVTPTGHIFIGGNATSDDGSTAANYAKATFNTFKCYNVVCNENKIKGFLEVE